MGADLHNPFFCESCDGSLQQVTSEIVKIFSGYFRRCVLRHDVACVTAKNSADRCWGSTLSTSDTARVQIHKQRTDREDMFPITLDFATDHNIIANSVQVRLPDMLEERIHSSMARQISTRSLRQRAGSHGAHQEPQVITQASGSAQGLTAFAEEEYMAQMNCEVGEGAVKDVDSMRSERDITDLDVLVVQDAEVVDLDGAITENEAGTVTDEPSNIHNRSNSTDGDKTVSHGVDGNVMESVEFVQSDWILVETHSKVI